ncbi:hypothetical protein [Methanoregula sp.]|uniref:hypothetical protein n=1 Tax=Methanoregula sp. TaxID=2052170 RepID=UPI0035633A67
MNTCRKSHIKKPHLVWLIVIILLVFYCVPVVEAALQPANGTDYIIEHDPDTNISVLYLNHGQMVVSSPVSGKMITVNAGQKVTIDSKGIITVETFAPATWNDLNQNVEADKMPTQKTALTTIIPILALMCFIGFQMRKK